MSVEPRRDEHPWLTALSYVLAVVAFFLAYVSNRQEKLIGVAVVIAGGIVFYSVRWWRARSTKRI